MASKLTFWQKILLKCRPLFEKTLLNNKEKIQSYEQSLRAFNKNGMVNEFNFFGKFFFKSFFRKVKTLSTDIQNIRNLSQKGSLVFVIKNRGKFEYRYFNNLFLKEKLKLASTTNLGSTLWWRPFATIWKYYLVQLKTLYKNPENYNEDRLMVTDHLKKSHSVFINLAISRNDLFGLTDQNPLAPLKPIVDFQKQSEQEITIVPVHFLYDKVPEKSEKSFFEFLFGEKASPGAFRKIFMLIFHFRRSPQVKFGESISLKQFLLENTENKNSLDPLYQKIEEVLSIERAKITGPKIKSKAKILKTILQNETFLNNLEELSDASGTPIETLKKEAENILNEIGADVNYNFVQFCYVILTYLWNNVYDGVVIKHEQLNKIRAVAGKTPIVLVPMHRSHIDYLLIAYIFYENNITYPHVCAGINMNFWPFGNFARKGGAFFIRRSFKGNKLYKETMQAYLQSLLEQNYCLEFYIEGTRSRTGKMLKPRLGILNMLLKAHENKACEDIHFVPIAINYDHILEEKAYESEKQGAKKKKESAGQLLKTRKFLGKKYGKVYIEFGDPISLNSYIQNVAKAEENLETLTEITESLGYTLTREMNKVALVTPMSLVSLAIVSLGKNNFTFDELYTNIQKIKDYLNYKQAVYSDLILYNESWAYKQTLQKLVSRHLIKEVATYEGNYYHIEAPKRARIEYYKNNILHFFVSLSCLAHILKNHSSTNISFNEILKEYKNFKHILSEEFTFSSTSSLEKHIEKVTEYAVQQGWLASVNQTNYQILKSDCEADLQIFANLTESYLESHLFTLKYLKNNTFQSMDQSTLAKDILEKSKPLFLKEEYKHTESLGQFTIENSLTTWAQLGLLLEEVGKKKKAYSSTNNPELVEQWIQKISALLKNSTSFKNTPVNVEKSSQEQSSVLH